MAPPVLLVEPIRVTAGSTWTWKASSPLYPIAEGWVLSYALNGQSVLGWSTSYISNDGTAHTIVIPVAATALTAGRYEFTRIWTGAGTYAGSRYTEILPALTVDVNPAAQGAGERVSFAETNLAYVETAYTARLVGDQPERYAIGGRSVDKIPLAELGQIRAALRLEVWRLRNPGQAYPRSEILFAVPRR